ncbi:ankyrin [Aspergillus crustosus]
MYDNETTKWMLEHGADPNRTCEIDETPLTWAVMHGSLDTIKLLFDHGGDVHKGEVLWNAIRETEVVEVLSILVKKCASVSGRLYEHHHNSWRLFSFMALGTALHSAAMNGKMDAVRYLVDQRTDLSIKDGSD